MQYIKAFFAGFLFIIVCGLCVQLAYLFLAMGYVELVKAFPWVATFGGYFAYFVGLIVYFLLMATGGVLTASIAKKHILTMCLLVGLSSTGLSAIPLLNSGEYSLLILVFFVLGILFTLTGGWYYKKEQA